MGISFLKGSSGATVKSLASDLKKFNARRDDLTAQLASQNTALADAAQAVQTALIDGSTEDVVAKAEAAQADASRRIAALKAALATINEQIAAVKSQHDDLISRELGAKIADEKQRDLDDLSQKLTRAIDALSDVVPAAERASPVGFMARQVADVCRSLPQDLSTALAAIQHDMNGYVDGPRSGAIRAKQTALASAPVVAKPKPIETRRIFTLTQLEYRSGDEVRTVGKHAQADLPIALADKSVALGYAVEMTSPRFRELSCGAVPAPMPNGSLLQGGKQSNANVDLDRPDLARAMPIFGADRLAAQGGVTDIHGRTYNPVGGV